MVLEQEMLTSKIIGAAIEIHNELGPGLLESAYEACFAYELNALGIKFQRQLPANLDYKGVIVDAGFRIDFLIEDKVVLELKAIEKVLPVHDAQVLTYLKLAKVKIGMLINFNVELIKFGIKRYVL